MIERAEGAYFTFACFIHHATLFPSCCLYIVLMH